MAGFYHAFSAARTTTPDPAQLLLQLRVADPTIGVASWPDSLGRIQVKKNSTWTAPQIAAAQNVIETAPALTPQSIAQALIDGYPIELRALVLALIDAINVLRTHSAIGLPAVTPAQAITAIRNKAATL